MYDRTKHGLIYQAPGNRDKVHTHEERSKIEKSGSVESGLASTAPICPEVQEQGFMNFKTPYWESAIND